MAKKISGSVGKGGKGAKPNSEIASTDGFKASNGRIGARDASLEDGYSSIRFGPTHSRQPDVVLSSESSFLESYDVETPYLRSKLASSPLDSLDDLSGLNGLSELGAATRESSMNEAPAFAPTVAGDFPASLVSVPEPSTFVLIVSMGAAVFLRSRKTHAESTTQESSSRNQ